MIVGCCVNTRLSKSTQGIARVYLLEHLNDNINRFPEVNFVGRRLKLCTLLPLERYSNNRNCMQYILIRRSWQKFVIGYFWPKVSFWIIAIPKQRVIPHLSSHNAYKSMHGRGPVCMVRFMGLRIYAYTQQIRKLKNEHSSNSVHILPVVQKFHFDQLRPGFHLEASSQKLQICL